jgi:multimeric flavodoxin WrbA
MSQKHDTFGGQPPSPDDQDPGAANATNAATPLLLVTWWSNTDGARQLADAAARAAREQGSVRVRTLRADEAQAQDLLQAAGMVFATPECLGSMAGPMKAFFDRTYYDVLERLAGRPYGTIVCAGTDGQPTIRQIDRIATGWRLRPVADPILVITGAQSPEAILAPKSIPEAELERARELGAALAAGLAMGIW